MLKYCHSHRRPFLLSLFPSGGRVHLVPFDPAWWLNLWREMNFKRVLALAKGRFLLAGAGLFSYGEVSSTDTVAWIFRLPTPNSELPRLGTAAFEEKGAFFFDGILIA